MKTLIEIFDECQTENIMASLYFVPERIIFLGFTETMTAEKINSLKKFYELRNAEVNLEFEYVPECSLHCVSDKIGEIVGKYPECCIDITGGKDIILTATGVAVADKDIPVIRIDKNGEVKILSGTLKDEKRENVNVSIKEIIALNGGATAGETEVSLNEEFKKDIKNAWSIAKEGCGNWNRQTTAFGIFERVGRSFDPLEVKARYNDVKKARKEFYLNRRIITALIEKGLIKDYHETYGEVSFRYKNDDVRRLLTKAGNVLEFYAFILLSETGKYNDLAVGLIVDWDGVVGGKSGVETRNEIDIMLMDGFTPVFISCKNGEVHKEALYELSSLSERFGGEYGKKVLLSTYLSGDEEKKKYIVSRASDMKINLISGLEETDENGFKEKIKEL